MVAYCDAKCFINSSLTPYAPVSVSTPSIFLSVTLPSRSVTVMSMSLTTTPLLAGSITSTESPAMFRTFLHSRAWSCPISTISKPGTLRATSSEAFSRYLPPISRASCPAWNMPITMSGRSFSRIIFIHLRAVSSMSSKRSPFHRFSDSHTGMAGVIMPRTTILTPSRSSVTYGGKWVLPVAVSMMLAPSTGAWQSPAQRSNTARPVSTSWLPMLPALYPMKFSISAATWGDTVSI